MRRGEKSYVIGFAQAINNFPTLRSKVTVKHTWTTSGGITSRRAPVTFLLKMSSRGRGTVIPA